MPRMEDWQDDDSETVPPRKNRKTSGSQGSRGRTESQSMQRSGGVEMPPPHMNRAGGGRASAAKARAASGLMKRSDAAAVQTSTSSEEKEDEEDAEEEDMEDEEDEESEKTRIRLDHKGVPVGNHEPTLNKILQKFARDLDPSAQPCWHGQEAAAKRRLMRRVRSEFEFYGDSHELSESWFNTRMSKCVTRVKFQINSKIRAGMGKPADIPLEHWEKLVALQDDPAVKEKSQLMSNISLGRPAKSGATWQQHMAAVSTLVSSHAFI